MTDVKTKVQYLIDTGSDVSVYPRNLVKGPLWSSPYQLYAANGTIIRTYGQITLEPNFGLRSSYLQKGRLIDGKTELFTKKSPHTKTGEGIKAVAKQTSYHDLLTAFSNILNPTGNEKEGRDSTVHHIKMTSGPPEGCRPRRLAPDKLKAARPNLTSYYKKG
ncbi:gag-pol polyprotein, partial [Lasius niger]